jgi:hypothetical protein
VCAFESGPGEICATAVPIINHPTKATMASTTFDARTRRGHRENAIRTPSVRGQRIAGKRFHPVQAKFSDCYFYTLIALVAGV